MFFPNCKDFQTWLSEKLICLLDANKTGKFAKSNTYLKENGILYFISVYALQEETTRIALELDGLRDKTKENQEKIKLNKQLPYLVGNVVEVSRI